MPVCAFHVERIFRNAALPETASHDNPHNFVLFIGNVNKNYPDRHRRHTQNQSTKKKTRCFRRIEQKSNHKKNYGQPHIIRHIDKSTLILM